MVVSFCSLIYLSFVAVKQHDTKLSISSHVHVGLESEASTPSAPLSSKDVTDSTGVKGTDPDASPSSAGVSQSNSETSSVGAIDNNDHRDEISDSGKSSLL